MSLAFWSVPVTSEKPVEVQPPEGYVLNIQQAAAEGGDKGTVVIKAKTLSIEDEEINAVVGTLRPGTVDQISLGKVIVRNDMKRIFKHFVGLVFGYEVPVTFSVTGKGTVHLTGYFQPGPDADLDDDDDMDMDEDEDEDEEKDDEEDEEEDEEEPRLVPVASKPPTSSKPVPTPTPKAVAAAPASANKPPSKPAPAQAAKPTTPGAKAPAKKVFPSQMDSNFLQFMSVDQNSILCYEYLIV